MNLALNHMKFIEISPLHYFKSLKAFNLNILNHLNYQMQDHIFYYEILDLLYDIIENNRTFINIIIASRRLHIFVIENDISPSSSICGNFKIYVDL